MDIAATPRAAARKSPAVQWPAPPFFRLAEPLLSGQGRECALELIDGRVLREELVEFALGVDSVGLQWAQPQGIKRIDFAKIRSLKLTQPVAYVADAAALDAIGAANPPVEAHKPFTIQLCDGTKMIPG